MTPTNIEKLAEEILNNIDFPREVAKKHIVNILEQAPRAEFPSFEEFRLAEKELRRKSGKDAPMDAYWAYDWLKERMK